ncbi:unnamed protein product [Cyclocybe aegerita]|uniref:Zn(2)-C6 fungal-type domain-containing protein n=1 Tax=Cyclocybe aegerita TaxID=1973307 RepID=A0A8S0XYQ4_CYCAE|nr:unnamed protein product [Cyclocybe aegerita]
MDRVRYDRLLTSETYTWNSLFDDLSLLFLSCCLVSCTKYNNYPITYHQQSLIVHGVKYGGSQGVPPDANSVAFPRISALLCLLSPSLFALTFIYTALISRAPHDPMFNFTDPSAHQHPLFPSQPLVPPVSYHQQDYNSSYTSAEPHLRQPRLVSISRTLQARGHPRHDVDTHNTDQGMHHHDGHHVSHDSWNSFSDSSSFVQSYQRHAPDASHLRATNVSYHTPPPSVPLQPAFSNLNELSPFVTTISPTNTPTPPPEFSSRTPLPAMSGSLSEQSDSDFWPRSQTPAASGISRVSPAVPERAASDPPKPRRARRERPRIALAPDQPPTTQGKVRARVYVACVQCRTRKIRCDGAKPVCHNCGLRSNGCDGCNYDPAPKRRGPDKIPGGRQRRDPMNEIDGLPRRRRRRTTRESDSSTSESNVTTLRHLQADGIADSRPHSSCSTPFKRDSSSDISSTTSEFMSASDYSRSPYNAIGRHPSLTQPSDLPPPSDLFDPRKPATVGSYDYHWA